MMMLQPSDSMSSMGSTIIRVDSQAGLSQTSSFKNFNTNQTSSGTVEGAGAAGSNMRFMGGVVEAEHEEGGSSDEESTLERI